jgi:hypothetical protein
MASAAKSKRYDFFISLDFMKRSIYTTCSPI